MPAIIASVRNSQTHSEYNPVRIVSTCQVPKAAISRVETALLRRTDVRERTIRVKISCPMKTAGMAKKRSHKMVHTLAWKTMYPTRSHNGSTKAAGRSHR